MTRIRSLRRLRPLPERESPDVAQSVAIIMDGNGRWAKRRGLPTAAGHRAGARTRAPHRRGLDRPRHPRPRRSSRSRPRTGRARAEEVDALMDIFAETIERELPDLAEQGVRVRFIGRRDRAPEELSARMAAMEDRTELNSRLNLWVAFDYGGRAELVEAARRLVESGVDAGRDRRERVRRATSTRPSCPTRTCSSAPPASSASRTSCSGSSPTPSSPSSTSSGPTSARATSSTRSTSTRAGAGASAADDDQPHPVAPAARAAASRCEPGLAPARRRVGLPLVLGLVWLGHWWLFALVLVAGVVALHEFYAMTRPLRPIGIAGHAGLVGSCSRSR